MFDQEGMQKLIQEGLSFSGSESVYRERPQRNKKIEMTDNATEIFNRRYRRKNSDGSYAETIEETFDRVASVVASGETSDVARAFFSDVFYNMLTSFEFIPNAPTWTGAGTRLGQLAACFVLPLADDMGKEDDGIFSTLRNAALIQQTGGGNGFSLSRIRPKGDLVNASMGKATGPVGFLEVYDAAFGVVAQGGVRRGANMAVMRVDHPDIRDFITCKAEEGKIANFNISVAITDEFMNAVQNGSLFDLRSPKDGSVKEQVDARELFDLIVTYAHRNGEPGVLFIDEANRYNPVPNQYELEATNPCGEQWLGPYENCCLGHINIAKHIKDGRVDWQGLARVAQLGTRFLDDVVTANKYVPAVPQLKESAMRNRRIGLGYLGLADAMYDMGIRYGSDEGAEFTAQITEFIRYYSMITSIQLAKEKGAFPGIQGSIYDPQNPTWKKPLPLRPYAHNWGRPVMNWEIIADGIRRYGIRNSTQLTVAPTGSTSTVANVEGYGCEPVFALAYYRNVYQAAGQDENLTLTYVSPSFNKALDSLNLSKEEKALIVDEVIDKGTCQHIDRLPKAIRDTFVVSSDITPEEHVLMQASIQPFVDNSISKTCNFPEGATKEDVKRAYFQAWESKCKGLTVYVTGSREEVVLETKETKDKKEKGAAKETVAEVKEQLFVVKPRAAVLEGLTMKRATPLGSMYITVNKDKEKDEFREVFVNIGKAGSDVRADSEAIGRLISLILRLGTASGHQRMSAIIEELEGISSGMEYGFGKERISSIPDAIAKSLQDMINSEDMIGEENLRLFDENEENKVAGSSEVASTDRNSTSSHESLKTQGAKEMCPKCGNYSLMRVEGCKKCLPQLGGCGTYSQC